jgi:molybdopterin-biosynthesis enzyme MoeA-like protein
VARVAEIRALGMLVIGDELLSGKRRDQHLAHVIAVLAARGMEVAWCRYEGDARERLVESLRQTRRAVSAQHPTTAPGPPRRGPSRCRC